ncbi:hypothetical protein [Pseudoclavibacter sp. VKM Ac-2888]|uniref:hypothetical protein n=1 Tax=Pseudoclavibacter sp. VKM Ac-2888 TaxID=2783830 RepID=UPI00188AF6E0|nr:hypothetical protein [Pseudoclavibacter sp. VKM Ac-2888]MBF4549335.1 hypothetical protein [Pseudoclavibacter sp. VKM Ac-2888]
MGATAAVRQDAHASRREAHRGNGVSQAGQFGHQPHSAPTGPLFDPSVTSEEMREVLDTFKGAVMKRAGSRKWSKEDVDDIAQEALVYFANRLWTDQLKREPENRTPLHLHRALREHGGMLLQMIPRSSQDVMFGEQKIDHRDIKATALLQQSDVKFQELHGRSMNNGERNREAMRIREEEFGDKKPTLEFHKRQTNVSVNQLVGTSSDGVGFEMGELMEARAFAAPQAFAQDTNPLLQVEEFEAAQGGYELLERKAGHKKPVAADFGLTPDNAWNTLAEQTGAPTVTAQSLPHKEATASGVVVQQFDGGAAGLALAINDGSASEAATDAFYAPFGGTKSKTLRELRTIASAFIAQPKYADRLYASALGTARMPEPEATPETS